jgi:hypothetical protein
VREEGHCLRPNSSTKAAYHVRAASRHFQYRVHGIVRGIHQGERKRVVRHADTHQQCGCAGARHGNSGDGNTTVRLQVCRPGGVGGAAREAQGPVQEVEDVCGVRHGHRGAAGRETGGAGKTGARHHATPLHTCPGSTASQQTDTAPQSRAQPRVHIPCRGACSRGSRERFGEHSPQCFRYPLANVLH